jgi:serine-type D-Ala-D-Ala carboxypeptidase (penicillin-binding protein 5/6)
MNKNLRYFLIGLVLSLPVFGGVNVFQERFDSYLTAQISRPLESIVFAAFPEKKPKLDINADAAMSLEISTAGKEKILFEKNINESLPIASLTKLMTAVIVLNNPDYFNFSKVITITSAAAGQGDTPNYGNLKAGEQYTLEKLMELMLVYSSNDAAFAISEVIGTDNFVEAMNQKRSALDMNDTYFMNPTGLDPQKTISPEPKDLNYSTAGDLAGLAGYILQNLPQIFEISRQGQNYRSIENGLSNLKLDESQKFIGGKTGYTKNARGCILFIFQDKNGSKFINVILGTETEEERITEMQKVIDWISS